jgi:hypothetical protein
MDDDETVRAEGGAPAEVHLAVAHHGGAPRYRRRSALGEGGMGEVWLERDERIGRDVAIKTLKAKGAASDVAARFLREARVQGQLEHPSIVPVYDLGWNDAGEPFFTMKRVQGHTLLAILMQLERRDPTALQRFTQRRLLTALSQVCLALELAHQRGVVHRDIKPANIMLGDHGEVYVLDWGIAKIAGVPDPEGPHVEADGDETPATMAGTMLGTLAYMSPEQARGDSNQVEPRSDVYALGAVLFELLTLQRWLAPGSVEERKRQILAGVDARISVRFPHLSVAPELEDLCVRATRLEIAERLPSARALADGIERFLDGVRDEEMRERRVRQHLERVRARMPAAMEGDDSARDEVGREAGAALALSPDDVEARRAVVELLTHPPARVPEEVERGFQAARAHDTKRYYEASFLAAFIYAPFSFAALAAREHGVVITAAHLLCFAAVAVFSWRAAKTTKPAAWHAFAMHTLWTLCAVPLFAIVHPLVILPVLFGTSILTATRHVSRATLWWTPIAGVAPLVLACIAAYAGIAGSTGYFTDGVLQLPTNVSDEWSSIFVAIAWLMSIVPLVLGSMLVASVQRRAEDTERALHLSRWQLAKLLPSAVSDR